MCPMLFFLSLLISVVVKCSMVTGSSSVCCKPTYSDGSDAFTILWKKCIFTFKYSDVTTAKLKDETELRSQLSINLGLLMSL